MLTIDGWPRCRREDGVLGGHVRKGTKRRSEVVVGGAHMICLYIIARLATRAFRMNHEVRK